MYLSTRLTIHLTDAAYLLNIEYRVNSIFCKVKRKRFIDDSKKKSTHVSKRPYNTLSSATESVKHPFPFTKRHY